MDALVGDVVFAVGDTRYFVDDVGRAAKFWGEQGHLEGQLREGLACLKHAATNEKSAVKGGRIVGNHNETLVGDDQD